MSFYGKTFIYDNTPSEVYGLYILDFETSGGYNESEAGSVVEPIEEWVYRRSKSYHYGNIMNTPLEFDYFSREVVYFCSDPRYDSTCFNEIYPLRLARAFFPVHIDAVYPFLAVDFNRGVFYLYLVYDPSFCFGH